MSSTHDFARKGCAAHEGKKLRLRDRISTFSYFLLVGVSYCSLLYLYGMLPGHINEISSMWSMAGETRGLVNRGLLTFGYVKNMGGPLGFPFVAGLPFYYLAAFISVISGLSSYMSSLVAGIIFLLVALVSMVYLLRRLGVNRFVAVICSYLFLSLSMNYGQARYGSMMYGFVLMPLYVLIDFLFINYLRRDGLSRYKTAGFFLLYTFVKTFALFMDGYSFVISSTASFFIMAAFVGGNYVSRRNVTVNKGRWFLKSNVLAGVSIFVVAHLIALSLYKLYVPGGASYSIMPLDVFRSEGADLITFLVPGHGLWFLDWLGLTRWWDYRAFYGDGCNVLYNYLGYTILFMFVGFFSLREKKSYFVKALVVAGFFTLVMSIGPSLKINDTRTSFEKSGHVVTSDYFMPEEAATLNLHTGFIYLHVPGLKNMRVLTRWLLLFKFVMLICAGLFLTFLVEKKKYILAAFLIVFSLLEMQPDVLAINSQYQKNYAEMVAFDPVLSSLKKYVHKNDRVFFLSDENDYMANYICSDLDIRCYNNGGDKNMELSWKYLPREIQYLRRYKRFPPYIINSVVASAMSRGLLDVLVIPFFNLRWDSYKWPPTEKKRVDDRRTMLAKFYANDPRFSYSEEKWFGVVKLRRE